AIPNPLLGLA
nr:Chain P, cleaved peptide fragment corresponding to the C-terminal His tag [Escherichia coli]